MSISRPTSRSTSRAHFGRTLPALITVAATIGATALLTGLAPAAHATGTDNGTVLGHLNALRAAHGLPRLSESSDLMSIAAGHSVAMAHSESLYHNPSLTSEVQNWQVLGENVGMGPSATAIDTAFDHSPEHYANEINPAYTQVGIGTASDSRGYLYITVDFRKPMNAPAPAHAPAPTRARTTTTTRTRTTTAPSHTTSTTRHAVTPVRSAPSAASVAAAAARQRAAAQAAAVSAQRARVVAIRRSAAALRPLTGTDPLAQAVDFSRTLTSLAG